MGGWIGGQAQYVMVPYADFNLLRFPDRDQALAKIKDLTLLTDILPTRVGTLGIRIGLGWAKSHSFFTGQTPVMKYNRRLMQAILHDKIQIAKAVNVPVISLEDALAGYHDFDKGAAKKFVINPNGMIAA
jgi:threonine dehydrogenase-like Zn-dependent dehydrogenase